MPMVDLMPIRSDDPLRRVTLNLYEEDVEASEKLYGHGWSTELRRVWHEHVYSRTNQGLDINRLRTLGDLADE